MGAVEENRRAQHKLEQPQDQGSVSLEKQEKGGEEDVHGGDTIITGNRSFSPRLLFPNNLRSILGGVGAGAGAS